MYKRQEGKEGLSFRDIVHQYTKGHKWDELGIDMCLGSEADKPIDAVSYTHLDVYKRQGYFHAGEKSGKSHCDKNLYNNTHNSE